jgi:predicted O-methyltransferase YrrM
MENVTDKVKNGLIAEYEKVFADIKDVAERVLEVGTYRGGSLIWLTEQFPNALILGLDIIEPQVEHERIEFELCDQNDSASLQDFGFRKGPFDVIIDDGSHKYAETKNTFDNLFKYLKSGGLYVIEDFIASYWPEYPQYKDLNTLVFDIASRKNELGICDFSIILKEPKCSIAVFKKI